MGESYLYVLTAVGKLKVFFWVSPSLRSRLFSCAEQPSSLLVFCQWRGQWYLMELHMEGECGAFNRTRAVSRSLIVPWYRASWSLRTGMRSDVCTFIMRSYTVHICRRTSGGSKSVVPKKMRRWRAIETCHPPLIRIDLSIHQVTPFGNVLNPSLPPSSTFLFGAVTLAMLATKESTTRQACKTHVGDIKLILVYK